MLSDIFFQQMANYTNTQQEIIDFICRNPGTFLTASISQLAERLGISDASLSRLARHAGYRDYKELKAAVTGALSGAGPAEKLQGSLSGEKGGGLDSFLSWQQTCLQKTLEMIDRNAFEQAVEQIASAKRIFLHGKGASRCLAQLLDFRLNRFGKDIFLMPSGGTELFEDISRLQAEDLVICFGFQKLPREDRVLLSCASQAGCRSILFCSRVYAAETSQAGISLLIYRGEPEEYHSMAAPMAVIDALVVQVAAAMGEDAVRPLERLHALKQEYYRTLPG